MSLAEAFAKAFQPPPEEELYKAAINKTLWSIDEAAALIAGLTRENYKNGSKGSMTVSEEEFRKREDYATTIFSQMLDDLEKKKTLVKFIPIEDRIYFSPWRYIKWVAENEVKMHKRFFNELPLSLMELYFEFQPINIALRTASKHSRGYHEALYLKHAEEILETSPDLSPSEIYRHPHMQNVGRYIRELGGKYKKRTILESWLPKIINSFIGRPKKNKKAPQKNTVSN